MKLTHASVFSGIGGPEVAATMLGWDNLFHCEINPFGRAVLDYWYPNAKSYDDITKTDFTEWRGRVNVLTGGFPCQPFSYAGQRRGASDDRYLWPYMFRCIDQIRPDWVVCENVAGILTMVEQGEVATMADTANLFGEADPVHRYRLRETFTLQRICDDLESHGYSVQPVLIPACAVGAPHRRDRVFIVGHRIASDTDGGADGRDPRQDEGKSRKERIQERDEVRKPDEPNQVRPEGAGYATADTDSVGRSERWCKTDGREHDNIRAQVFGITEGQGSRGITADTINERLQRRNDGDTERHGQSADGCSRQSCKNNGRTEHVADTSHTRCKRENESRCSKAGEWMRLWGAATIFDVSTPKREHICGERWQAFPTVSPVHRGNDGLPFPLDDLAISAGKWRTESLKAYGNAIVPQVIYEIFRSIEQTYNDDE